MGGKDKTDHGLIPAQLVVQNERAVRNQRQVQRLFGAGRDQRGQVGEPADEAARHPHDLRRQQTRQTGLAPS